MKYLRIAVLLLGMACLVGGAGLFAKNYMRTAETRSWPRVEGRVTESRVDTLHAQEVGNEGDFMPHVRYDYVVGGRTLHGDILWLDEHRSFGSANVAARELAFLEAGTEVEVLYNPQNPAEAALMVDKPSWRYFFLALLGALVTFAARPRRRPQQPAPQPGLPAQPGMQPQPGMEPQLAMQPQPGMQVQPQTQPPGVQPQPPMQPQFQTVAPQLQQQFPAEGRLTVPAPKPTS